MEKLTVLIPCKNERHNLRACVESVRPIADEVLVADSGSTDGTLELARELGCRLIEREYINPSDFKNWAIPQATHPWVLILDADERASEALVAEIREILSTGSDQDGYTMQLDNFFLGHRIHHCGWNTTRVLRFFRRDLGRYREQRVHESMEISTGRVGPLEGKFIHHTCSSLAHYLEKMNRYTTWSAQDAFEAGRRTSLLRMFFRPPLRFFQFYVLRAGFLDGMAGLVVCMLSAFYTFLKCAKLWELEHGRPHFERESQRFDPASDRIPSPFGDRKKAGKQAVERQG